MKIKTLTLAIATATASTYSFAQTIELDTIVVTANKTEQSIQNITSNVTVITAEEIEAKHYTSLAEALNEVTGISFTRNGGIGSVTSLLVRGSSNNRTLVLIDGIRVYDPSSTTGADFVNINLNNVERIEIIKGAQSGVWGADAAAGVINIITRSNASEINIEYGAFNTRKASVATHAKVDETHLSLNANRTLTDGFSTLKDDDEDDAHQNTNVVFKAKTHFNEAQSLGFIFNHTNSYSEYDASSDPKKRNKTKNNLLGLDFAQGDTRILFQQSQFQTNQLDEGFTDQVEGKTQSFEIQQHINDWLLGVQHSQNETDSEKPSFFYDSNNGWAKTYQNQNIQSASNHANAAFLTHQTQWNQFVTNEAIRWDDYSQFGSKVTGKLGIKYRLNSDSAISANYGTAYNSPSMIQILNPWGESNPNLSTENSTEWSVTYQYQNLSITHFDKRVEDLIEWKDSQYQNLEGITEIQGSEFEYKMTFGRLNLALNYTHLDTDLIRRPEDQVGLNIDWYVNDKLDLNINGQYIGKRSDAVFDPITYQTVPVETGHYTVWNTVANYQFNSQFAGYLKVDNLFNKDYQVVEGYSTPERSVYAGIKATF